jgi:DNA-binding CsgD family transcriptional regulator
MAPDEPVTHEKRPDMLQPEALDPYTKSLLTLLGQTLLALAGGELTPTLSARADALMETAREQLRSGGDSPRRHPSRKRYHLVTSRKAHDIGSLTPAGQEIAKLLQGQPNMTLQDLIEATKLKRKTVENLLSTMRKAGILVSVEA